MIGEQKPWGAGPTLQDEAPITSQLNPARENRLVLSDHITCPELFNCASRVAEAAENLVRVFSQSR